MPSPQKRPLEDFFKPYGRSNTTIPQKRSSPSSAEDDEPILTKRVAPKTPAKTVTFKDVTPRSIKIPLFSPLSQNSLPIRSPRQFKVSSPSTNRHTTLFHGFSKSSPRDAKPNTSFTFPDISERSQQVVEVGKVVTVKDSDDDTDSLESLDDIFGRKNAVATSDSSPPEDTEAERVRTLSTFTSGRSVPIVGKDKLRALYAKERTVKFDLGAILDDHFGDEEAQQNILKMRAGFAEAKELDEDDNFDKHLLASVVQAGDANQQDVERLINAVERTEALSTEKQFSFFTTAGMLTDKSSRKDIFPVSAIPDKIWTPENTNARNRAYLSGYMSELAASGDLADEALKWTFNQVVKEIQVQLQEAYILCLKASSTVWTRLNITASDVQEVFNILGARADCLRDGTSIEPKHQPIRKQQISDYSNLLSAIRTFREICPDMDFSALSKLSSIVLRLALDKTIMSNNRVCVEVERLLETLLNLPGEEARTHVYDRLLYDAKEHLHNPQLQVQLLSHILPTTFEAKELRKTLADVFLLGPSRLNTINTKSDATFDELLQHVQTCPSFSLTRHTHLPATDYSALTARTQILNVAISSGNPHDASNSIIRSPSKTVATKSPTDESQFNSSVDRLADQLHNLFVSIKDTGASHMRRTEAKDALQALYFRLLFSVRTKPRKKRHVFDPYGEMKAGNSKARWVSGEEYREKERGEEFMKKFFVKQEIGGC